MFLLMSCPETLLSAVPATPEILVSECQVCDNSVSVAWALPEPDTKIDHYILEHRRTNHEGPPRIREDYPWMVVEGIRVMEHTLTGGRMSVEPLCREPCWKKKNTHIYARFSSQAFALTPATSRSE